MGQTVGLWPGTRVLLATFLLLVLPALAWGQVPFPSSPAPGQAEPTTGPTGQPGSPPGAGGQAQPASQAGAPAGQAPAPIETQAQDPFAGSRLLQMFERQPDVAAPLRQLRFAPAPTEPFPLNVRLFLTAEEEFTDNADQTKDNRRSEFRTRIAPGISVRADRPSATVGLSYAPEVLFPRNSIGDTEVNQNASLRATLWPAGRFQFSLADDFTDSNDFRDVQDPGTRRRGAADFLQNQVTAEAAYALPRLRTALAYTNVINQRRDLPVDDTRIAHIVRPNMLYRDPRFSAAGSFALTRGNENSSLVTPYWRYEGDGRYLHVVTPTISAGLTGKYAFQEPDEGRSFTLGRGRAIAAVGVGPSGTLQAEAGADFFTRQDESTKIRPSFLASYTHRFFAFAVTARYEEGYRADFEDVDSGGITFTRSAGVFLTSAFFRNLVATLGVRYEENKFQDTTVLGATAGTTDRTWDVDVELRYLLVRSLFLTAAYTGTFRTSTDVTAEFNENRARLGLTYEYNLF